MTPFQRLIRNLLHVFTGALIVGYVARAAEINVDGLTVADIPQLTIVGISALVAAFVALLAWAITAATSWTPTSPAARAVKTFAMTFLGTASALWAQSAASVAENGYHADDIGVVTKLLGSAAVAALGALVAYVHNASEDAGVVAPIGKGEPVAVP